MKLTRRDALRRAALAASAAFLPTPCVSAAEKPAGPRRFVYFLMGNGFHPDHARPKGLDTKLTDKMLDIDLKPHALPDWIAPLEPFKDLLTIVHGVNGEHCNTNHGSPFGCLAGVKKGKSPTAESIDHAIARLQPKTPLPLLGFGLSNLERMKTNPLTASCSAAGDSRPVPLFADPRMAFQNVFGCVAGGKTQAGFEAEMSWFDELLADSTAIRKRLGGTEADKFDTYLNGLKQAQQQRLDLLAIKDRLGKYVPKYGESFTHPTKDTDWWEANLEIGLAALRAGVTNVLTIDGGLSGPDGMPLNGLGLDMVKVKNSHNLGHLNQVEAKGNEAGADEWLKVRHYSMKLLVRIITALKNEPEPNGTGSMLDNTVVVYTSDAAEVQHSTGLHWPFLLIGNLGGRLRTGRYLQYPSWGKSLNPGAGSWAVSKFETRPKHGRSINGLWATLLQAAGKDKVDYFNLSGPMKERDRLGPMEELLR